MAQEEEEKLENIYLWQDVMNPMEKQNLVLKLSYKLRNAGWERIVQNSCHLGWRFDLVCERRSFLTKWHILIKFVDCLDKQNVKEFENILSDISEESKSWIWGRCFLFCIIADIIDPRVVSNLERDSFGLFGVFRLKGGGGNIFLLDLESKKIYGEIPTIPYDVHKHSKDFKEILEELIELT